MSETLLDGLSAAEVAAVRYACEQSQHYFTRFFFKAREGGKFLSGRHHKLIDETLDGVVCGKIPRLIINEPPGYSKTEQAVIMFVARGFALNARARFLHSSYSQDLVHQNSASIRDVIALPEYQMLWPRKLRKDMSAKGLWRTPEGGMFKASPSGGAVTGFRAGTLDGITEEDIEDILGYLSDDDDEFIVGTGEEAHKFSGALIIDDPLKPDDANSDQVREFINQRYMNTFRSRLAHERIPILVIMQRIHTRDFSHHLLTGGGGEKFAHLMIPVEVDNSKAYPTEYTHGVPIPHGLPDGPLWTVKHTQAQINVLKADGKTFSAQYMQDPRHSATSVFPMSSFNSYEVRPRTLTVAILVDPSEGASKTSDRTAMAVIGIDQNGNKYLLDGYCHRMSLSERWTALKTLHQRWQRAPGVAYVAVGYEKYGMQSDLSYIRERQEIDGPHFPIEEINWPRSGGHAKEDRIQRLEPDFKGSRFFLPALIWKQEEGGECYWTAEDHGISYTRSRGPTSAMRRVTDGGEAWRVAQAIKRRDENGQLYDLTQTLINELKDFPNASHDDFSDAASRVYDLTIQSVSNKEMNEAAALNEMDIWS